MKSIQLNRNFDKVLRIASKGDIVGIQGLLKENPSILNKPSEGHNRTILWEAVNKNRIELVKYLINQGADVNIPGRFRSQTYVLLKPYCIAYKNNKESMQDMLLSNGHEMDIYSLSYLGRNKEIIDIVKKNKHLLNQLHKEDKIWKVCPLHFAVSANNISTIKILLNLGAEVKEHSKLLYEIACRNDNIDIIKRLTKFGGNPTDVDVFPVFYNNNIEVINYFVNKGLNCDKLLGKDWPPIVYLCRGDKGEHPQKIERLVKHVKNINAQTPNGVSALHAASKAGYLSIAKILLKNGAEINIRDKRGKTPLHYSRKYKRKEVEAYLINNDGIE